MMDRETAWARLFDPQTDAATLQEIAQHYPEFGQTIALHPNCYDGLREWLATAPPVEHAEPVEGPWDAAPTIVVGESAPSATRIPPAAPRTRPEPHTPPVRHGVSRRTKIIAITATALVVVAGGCAWAASSLLSGGSPAGSSAGGSQDAASLKVTGQPPSVSPFATGAKIAWHIGSGTDNNYQLVVDPQTWMATATQGGATTLFGLDAQTGAQRWKRDIPDFATCSPTSLDGSAYCVLSIGGTNQRIAKISLADGSTQKALPLTQSNPDTGVDRVAVLDGAIIVEQSEGDGGGYVAYVSKFPADLSAQAWNTTVQDVIASNAASTWPDVARAANGSLALSDGFADIGIDFATGAIVEASGAGTSDVMADGTFIVDLAEGDPATTINAGTHTIVHPADRSLSAVDFSDSAEAPPSPLFFSQKDDGTVSTSSYGADGSTTTWASPITTVASPYLPNVYGAASSGHLALVDTAGNVTSADPKTGAVQWSNSYIAPARTGAGADFTKPEPFYADANTLIIADFEGGSPGSEADPNQNLTPVLHAFDATTGRSLWNLDNVRLVHAPSVLGEPAVVQDGDTETGPLVGAAAASGSPTVPTASGLPACPAGMTPVSWSTYPGGHVLLCSGKTRYVVDLVIGNAARTCSTLAFDAVGYTLGCGGGSTVRVVGGGALVQFTSGSSGWTQPATATWSTYVPSTTTSTGFGTSPAKLPVSCPAGSSALSLSTWNGGWLLVCGTDAVTATSFVYRTSGTNVAGGAMTYQDGRYCGTDAAGAKVCASATPAVVTVTPQGGSATQYSAAANYFPSGGIGGAGKGTGAYGVVAPKDEAADQVRYLTQILQKSEQGRATISDLYANLLRCQADDSAVKAAASVVANRGDLLSALASTPVDKLDGGSRLVAELTQALSVSLEVDQQYQAAVGQVSGGDCPTGIATARAVAAQAQQTNTLKQTFVDDWNANVVSAYPGTPTFDVGRI